MISIIICSVSPTRLKRVCDSIARTIGVPHEIVVVDNRERGLGLCAAYNEGAERARHPLLCFMHEDVEFLTENWGERVLAHFESESALGLVGVAGGRYKAAVPSGWSTGLKQDMCVNVYHGADRASMRPMRYRPWDAPSIEVVALDGVWMCVRRNVWQDVRFDERVQGFHFYDVDFSLRVAERCKVAVIFDVDLLHYSMGSFGEDWAIKALAYPSVAAVELPRYVGTLSKRDVRVRELAATRYWLKLLIKASLPLGLRKNWLLASSALRSPGLWRLSFKFLLPLFKR